jgi:MFS family permease
MSHTLQLAWIRSIYTFQMITLAWGPVLWIPIANHYGRRPVWLISVIGAGLFNVGCAVSKTYSQHMICRILSVGNPDYPRNLVSDH